MSARRWLLVVVVLLVVVGLIAYARGREHRRGDDVGALGPAHPTTAVVVASG
jgi:Flp pilus assembly protein CpaB